VTVACFGMSVGAFPDAERAGLASAPLAERYFSILSLFIFGAFGLIGD